MVFRLLLFLFFAVTDSRFFSFSLSLPLEDFKYKDVIVKVTKEKGNLWVLNINNNPWVLLVNDNSNLKMSDKGYTKVLFYNINDFSAIEEFSNLECLYIVSYDQADIKVLQELENLNKLGLISCKSLQNLDVLQNL